MSKISTRDYLTLAVVGFVLRSELYAIPALIGAGCAAAATSFGYQGTLPALGAAAVCFVIRMIGVRFDLDAPQPPGHP